MKVYLQTNLTPSIEIYDTEQSQSEWGFLRKLFAPQIVITDNQGNVLYSFGDEPKNYFPIVLVIASGLLALWVLK